MVRFFFRQAHIIPGVRRKSHWAPYPCLLPSVRQPDHLFGKASRRTLSLLCADLL